MSRLLNISYSLLSLMKVYINSQFLISMISRESQFRVSISRDTEFFVQDSFPSFSEDIRALGQAPNFISSIEIRCSGHGYFSEYQERAKNNLKQYLKQSLSSTPNLHNFKLVFNGFNIQDQEGYLATILSFLKQELNRSGCNIKTVWVHTNNLSSCCFDDYKAMIQLIAVAGRQTNREELSLQISNWQLTTKISFKEMIGVIEDELVGLPLKFRVLRLEISSWLLNMDDAYHFIKSSLPDTQMIAKLNYNGESKEDAKLYVESVRNKPQYEHKNNKAQIAERIKKNTGRNIVTQFTYYNVKHFQEKLVALVKSMLGILEFIEDFTIDFRNWHPILKLQDIRSQLESKVGPRRQFSFCQKVSMTSQIRKKEAEKADAPLRTNYLL